MYIVIVDISVDICWTCSRALSLISACLCGHIPEDAYSIYTSVQQKCINVNLLSCCFDLTGAIFEVLSQEPL